MSSLRGPRFDFFTLSDLGSGRFLQHEGPLILERLDGASWVHVGRYGNAAEAAKGLDERLAAGELADHLRLRPIHRTHRWFFWRNRDSPTPAAG